MTECKYPTNFVITTDEEGNVTGTSVVVTPTVGEPITYPLGKCQCDFVDSQGNPIEPNEDGTYTIPAAAVASTATAAGTAVNGAYVAGDTIITVQGVDGVPVVVWIPKKTLPVSGTIQTVVNNAGVTTYVFNNVSYSTVAAAQAAAYAAGVTDTVILKPTVFPQSAVIKDNGNNTWTVTNTNGTTTTINSPSQNDDAAVALALASMPEGSIVCCGDPKNNCAPFNTFQKVGGVAKQIGRSGITKRKVFNLKGELSSVQVLASAPNNTALKTALAAKIPDVGQCFPQETTFNVVWQANANNLGGLPPLKYVHMTQGLYINNVWTPADVQTIAGDMVSIERENTYSYTQTVNVKPGDEIAFGYYVNVHNLTGNEGFSFSETVITADIIYEVFK